MDYGVAAFLGGFFFIFVIGAIVAGVFYILNLQKTIAACSKESFVLVLGSQKIRQTVFLEPPNSGQSFFTILVRLNSSKINSFDSFATLVILFIVHAYLLKLPSYDYLSFQLLNLGD